MNAFPSYENLRELIQIAKREDLGGDDVTSRLMVPEGKLGVGTLVQKEVGIVCGLPIVEMICRTYDERLRVELVPGFHMEVIEGRFSDVKTTPLLRMRSICADSSRSISLSDTRPARRAAANDAHVGRNRPSRMSVGIADGGDSGSASTSAR